ncbi:MAG: hypothetical protein WCO52_06700 [bacterium]
MSDMEFFIYHFQWVNGYTEMGSITMSVSRDLQADLERIFRIGNGEGLNTVEDVDLSMIYRAFARRSLMVGDVIIVNEGVFKIASSGFELAPELNYLKEGE